MKKIKTNKKTEGLSEGRLEASLGWPPLVTFCRDDKLNQSDECHMQAFFLQVDNVSDFLRIKK